MSLPQVASASEGDTSVDAPKSKRRRGKNEEAEPEPKTSPAEDELGIDLDGDGDGGEDDEPEARQEPIADDRDRMALMRHRVGFGAMRSLSGLNGLFVRYYVGHRFTLGLAGGFATFGHRESDDVGEFRRTNTVGALAVGPSVFFWAAQGPRDQQVHADFGIGLRILTYVGFRELEENERTFNTPLEVDIEIPAAVQIFIGRRVSINPEFGLVFRAIPGNREPDQNGESDANPGTGIAERLGATNGPGQGFELGNHAGLFMGIGVGYYFGRLYD
ncbi:MAG: hypothetical protein AAF799_13120 [Myxococcota bacterium]